MVFAGREKNAFFCMAAPPGFGTDARGRFEFRDPLRADFMSCGGPTPKKAAQDETLRYGLTTGAAFLSLCGSRLDRTCDTGDGNGS